MKEQSRLKLKRWLKKRSDNDLTEIYNILSDEFTRRSKSIEFDRNSYDNRRDSPEQMSRALENHFLDVFDKHHGF